MTAWRYEISLLVLKNISLVRCAHSWNIFQHSKRNFVSPRGHVISSIYYIDRSVLLENTPRVKIHAKLHPGPEWRIFHILISRLLHKLLGNFLATFGLSSNFWATYGFEHFFGNLCPFEHFFGNFCQSEKIYPFLVTKISFLCISSLTKRINIHVNSIVRLYWVLTSDYCHQWVPCVQCVVLVWSTELWVTCGCVFPARYMVSGLNTFSKWRLVLVQLQAKKWLPARKTLLVKIRST